MKIHPITFSLNKKSDSTKQTFSNPILRTNIADTVSFTSFNDTLTQSAKYLNTVVTEDIIPFIEDAKQPLRSVGEIGINAQEKLKVFHSNEQELYKCKFDFQYGEPGENLIKTKELTDRYEKYYKNLKRYATTSQIASGELIRTPDIMKKIEEIYPVMTQKNEYSDSAKTIARALKKTENKIDKLFEKQTLGNIFPSLAVDKALIENQKIRALYYVFMTPLKEACELVKENNDIQRTLKGKISNPLETYEKTERLIQRADKLLNDKNRFYELREELSEFVKNNKDYNLPDDNTINNAFMQLKNNCKKIYDENMTLLFDDYQKFAQSLDIDKIKNSYDVTLDDQNQVLEKLDSLVYESRQRYYAKEKRNEVSQKNENVPKLCSEQNFNEFLENLNNIIKDANIA